MQNVIIDVGTGKVRGINRQAMLYEREIVLPFSINPSKRIPHLTGHKQKTTSGGNLVYKKYTSMDENVTVVEQTDESISHDPIMENAINVNENLLENETINATTTIIENGEEKIIDNEPVMEDVYSDEVVYFNQNPFVFTEEEIIKAKKDSIDQNNFRAILHFDEMMDQETFDINHPEHLADLGVGFISIQPSGSIYSKEIQLSQASDKLELYIEMQGEGLVEVSKDGQTFIPFVDNIVIMNTMVESIFIRIMNTSDSRRCVVKSYGILG